jgi:hypothetical protein
MDEIKCKKKNIISYNDLEYDTMSYKDALQNDKRTFMVIYFSFIRRKHPFIFSFIPNQDHNFSIIKMNLFFFSFSIYFALNTLFFDFSVIHQIYEDKGIYKISSFLQQIIFSFFIAYYLNVIIKFFVLTERNFLELKREKIYKKGREKMLKVKRIIMIKNCFYFFIALTFLFFFWYYLSSFCAVYQNSQIILVMNTFLSFAISMIYPFIIDIIPAIIRRFSLSVKNGECLYKVNKFFQLL